MKSSIIALIAIISIILIAGCTQQQPSTGGETRTNNGSTSGNEGPPTNSGNPGPIETVEVNITSTGFDVTSLTINKGDTVKFTNNDSQPHWPASNPHPVHTDLAGFDARKGLQQGESYSFAFTQTGTFGFHDHLNPGTQGTITVNG